MALDRALVAGDLVAVTGASGFVGAHVVAAALRHGLRVRAVVRDADDPAKQAPVHKLLAMLKIDAGDRLSFASGDLLVPGSYDAAIAGCVGVAHVAAVARFNAPDPQRDIVDPSLQGVDNVYSAAIAAGTVARIAHTSSVAAILRPSDARRGHVFTEADWNTESTLATDPYGYAKAAAERRAWELVAALPEAERFGLVVLNPTLVLGRVSDRAHARTSTQIVRDLLANTFPACPALHFGFVDAEDVAEAHIQALLRPEASGRYILCAAQGWMHDLSRHIHRLYPALKVPTGKLPTLLMRAIAVFDKRVPQSMISAFFDNAFLYDARRSRDSLGLSYTPLDTTVRRTVDTLIDGGFARTKAR